ncbi:phosphoglycolate phosphatase [Bacteroidia bacterium]|nr:phosphoglycolate phosphatase [Bacteroidia bacterium]
MNYRNLLFDLDGTLTDPYLGITNAIKYALEKFHIVEQDAMKLALFIGPPLEQTFREDYHFSANDTQQAVAYYREYFAAKGIYENKLYNGIEQMLKELQEKNFCCIVATSKPTEYAVEILQHFKIDAYFEHVVGSNMDGSRSEKEDVVRYAIENYHLEKEKTIMIGDRKFDVVGAQKNGIASLAVGYGYGSREELTAAMPTYFCESIKDVVNFLMKN